MARTKRHKADPETVAVYVGMSPEFVARLDALAAKERRSRSTQAALLLEAALAEPAQATPGAA